VIEAENILISVEHRYVLKMLSGTKTAEIRRRQLRVQPGTYVWIYSKLPRGHVELTAVVDKVVTASPRKLWSLYQERIGVSRAEFESYLKGVEAGCVILLRDISALQPALDLGTIRRATRDFHPPQFFKRLGVRGPEWKTLAGPQVLRQ
jgi:predicted transcriptional regulator